MWWHSYELAARWDTELPLWPTTPWRSYPLWRTALPLFPSVMNEPTRQQWIYWGVHGLGIWLHPKRLSSRWHTREQKRPGYLNQGRYGSPLMTWEGARRRMVVGHVDHGKTTLTAAITFTEAQRQANAEYLARTTRTDDRGRIWYVDHSPIEEFPMKKRTEMVPYSVSALLSKDRPRRKPKPSRTKQQREARKVQRRNK